MTQTAQLTLKVINSRLAGIGLAEIAPSDVPQVLKFVSRERIVQALDDAKTMPEAVRFLESVLEKAGVRSMPNQAQPEPEPEPEQPPIRDDDSRPLNNGDRASFHVYGGKAALCFEADETRSQFPTIALDAAQAISARQYNWGKKVRLQMTRAELPVVAAVLLGVQQRCEFKNHGQDNSKGFSMERQAGGKVFVKVFAKDEGVKAVPIEPADVFYVTALVMRQLQKACPWLDSAGIAGLIRATQAKG